MYATLNSKKHVTNTKKKKKFQQLKIKTRKEMTANTLSEQIKQSLTNIALYLIQFVSLDC